MSFLFLEFMTLEHMCLPVEIRQILNFVARVEYSISLTDVLMVDGLGQDEI